VQRVDREFFTKTEVKGSKFLAYLVPYAMYADVHQRLKDENPKATHIIYAYRYLNEYGQIVENSSDDGEPKGSAGPPALNVLRGEEMVDVAVIVVRYFGGTKLGIGGMIRAYTLSVKNVIEESDIIKYEKEYDLMFTCTYSHIQRVEYLLNKIEVTNIEKEFLVQDVRWNIKATAEKLDEFKKEAGRDIECIV